MADCESTMISWMYDPDFLVASTPYPAPAQIVVDAKRDTARRGNYQHLEALDLLWTGAILADWAQKDCQEHPLNKRDFLSGPLSP